MGNLSENKNTKYFILGGIIAIIAIVITIIALIACNAWKRPIDKLVKGIKKADTEILLSAFPDFVKDEFKDELNLETMEKMLVKLGEALEDEYGDNYKISYKVVEKDKIEKDDLEKIEKAFNDNMDKSIKVSAGYKAKIKLIVKGKEDSYDSTSIMYLYKINGKWSYLPVSPSEAEKALK